MRNGTRGKVAADGDDFFAGQLSAQFRIGMAREVSAQVFRIVALRDISVQQALDRCGNFRCDASIAAQARDLLMFAHCAAEVSSAIRRSPAQWVYWASNGDLANLGLLSPGTDEAPAMAPILLTAQGLRHDGSADSVATQGRPVPAARSRRL